MSRLPTDIIPIAGTFADAAALAAGLTSSTGMMIAFFDTGHRIAWANERYAEWFGVTPEALVGRSVVEVYGREAYEEASPRLQRAMAGEPLRYERLLEKPGSPAKWISISLYPHRDAEGTVLGVFGCSIEVDELRRTRDALDRSLQEIAIYLDNSPLAVIEWDREGRIRRWAGQAERIFGWASSEVVGRNAEELSLVHPDWIVTTDAAMRELRGGRTSRNRLVCRNITRAGLPIYCEWFHSAFIDREGTTQGLLSLAQDISARMEVEEQLRHAVVHDALTGCYNRRYLMQRIEQAIDAVRPDGNGPALLYLDLDHFKPVNDRFGHAIGDDMLKAVVERLQACARDTDCIARVGGDEFVLFMDGPVDRETTARVRKRIEQRLGEAFRIGGHELQIGASIGVAHYPDDGTTADLLLRHADQTMYQVKQSR